MVTVVHEGPTVETSARLQGMRVSWGGIWGGVLVALGLLMLLTALGLAIGVSATAPAETTGPAIGTDAGIWASVSLLLSLFIGGMVATRIGAITDRTTGFFEGALVWVVSLLLIGYLATSGAGMLIGGAFRLVGGTAEAFGAAAQTQLTGIDLWGTLDPAWGAFIALMLSLAAALLGAMVGRRRFVRAAARPDGG
jgi:hypothetical protein